MGRCCLAVSGECPSFQWSEAEHGVCHLGDWKVRLRVAAWQVLLPGRPGGGAADEGDAVYQRSAADIRAEVLAAQRRREQESVRPGSLFGSSPVNVCYFGRGPCFTARIFVWMEGQLCSLTG